VDAGGATTVTTTASAAGHRTNEVCGPLVGASTTRNSLRASGLRPMCQDMMGTPTPACGSRTTGSHATPVERPTTSSSSRTYHFTSATLHAHGSSTCRTKRSTTGLTYVESSSTTSRACTCAPASSGSCAIARSSRGRVVASTYDTSPSAALSSPARPTTTPSWVSEWCVVHLPHPPTQVSHAAHDP
jgi:hypothetical protein